MHKNFHKSYLDSEPALHKCRVDKFLEVLFIYPSLIYVHLYQRFTERHQHHDPISWCTWSLPCLTMSRVSWHTCVFFHSPNNFPEMSIVERIH